MTVLARLDVKKKIENKERKYQREKERLIPETGKQLIRQDEEHVRKERGMGERQNE